MREPTSEQRAKERSFLFGNLADVGTNTLLLVMAIATGSLTMLSEAARSWLMLTISFYSYWLMRALHRERLTQYEFGVGKIEQFAWVVIGLNLVVAALWVSRSVVVTVFSTEPAATPLGLTLSAMVNAINLLVNFAGWHAMRVATRNDPSGVFAAQLRARLTMLLSSLFLQITLTVAALAKDELIALTLDAVGAIFVVGLMLCKGVPMVTRALPDLLDAPATEELRARIRAAAERLLPADDIVSIRTRRSGPSTFAEIAIVPAASASVHDLRTGTAALNHAICFDGTEAELALVVVPADPDGPHDALGGTASSDPEVSSSEADPKRVE